ncbi:MAG TPA: hypothetical protein VH476_05335 [Solirubrobacterales bacterium]|jgi:ribulose 1,5-bisphosphate synthetase/thiazole synthase
MINWRTSLAVAVLAVIAGLLAAGAPVDLVAAAPVVGAIYAALFLTGTRVFQWIFSKLLFKD